MGNSFTIKLITEPEYHLWNDALHARTLAEKTTDDWNRGTYVRWTILMSWIVLEMSCRKALKEQNIGRDFKDNINNALRKYDKKVNWGEGIWQKVIVLKQLRVKYVHLNNLQEYLWPDLKIAQDSIKIVRSAVKEVYILAGEDPPNWIDDNEGSEFK